VPTLCLGEAIVDLVCERHVEDISQAAAFVPHFGGAAANVAVAAAGTGAAVALAGGAGDDHWGRWLRDRLSDYRVDLRWFRLVEGCATPVAFVVTDHQGEPDFTVYGEGIPAVIAAVAPHLEEALGRSDALCFGSNTLVGELERELTMRAHRRALELERPVLFDPNLRLHRWRSVEDAVAAAKACVPGCLVVRCNRSEAGLLTGEEDPEAAARALLRAGARLALVTLGADGALLRGEADARVEGRPAEVMSTVGAGDVLMGVVLGRAAQGGFAADAIAAALPEAVEASSRATERWGAVA
jgi:sugar/nucleoside kinase (ribokinase family)